MAELTISWVTPSTTRLPEGGDLRETPFEELALGQHEMDQFTLENVLQARVHFERALELAITMAILGKGATKDEAVEIATSGEYTKVPINQKFPAYITYFTMGRDIDGNLKTFPDIYGRDKAVVASFRLLS